MFYVVHAELMIAQRAFLAHGHVAGAAKVFQRFVLVARTEHHTVTDAGRYESVVGFIAVFERQTVQTVIFETVHELMGHHAVGAERLLTIVTVSHHVRVQILTALAHASELFRVQFDRAVNGEVRQEASDTAGRKDALLVTVGARDLLRMVLVVF